MTESNWETRMSAKASARRTAHDRAEAAKQAAESAAQDAVFGAASTQALDLTTIAHCLQVLETELPGPLDWRSVNDEQKRFLGWLADSAEAVRQLTDLKGKASRDHRVLNEFLVAHGFEPKFQPFDGIGVASILDMLVKWLSVAHAQPIYRGGKKYPGFELDADVYEAQGFDEPLARLETQTGHSVWLAMTGEPATGLDLALTAQGLASASKRLCADYSSVAMPKLEISVSPDLDWLLGAHTEDAQGKPWYIDQAFQMFKLRLNEKGARAKVATGMMVAVGAAGPIPEPLVFDRPFLGYFTQPGIDGLPVAAFYAGIGSWKEPAGTLEELV